MTDVSNADDIIDSRDVIARIEELKAEIAELEGDDFDAGKVGGPDDPVDADLREELATLQALAEAGSNYAADWEYGETLIRDSYFKAYAEQLANDIGAIDSNEKWPLTCIDWDQAARELQMDYTAIEFGDVTYWIR
jgi:hypothetical protein